MKGRRVATVGDIEQPGDYCYVPEQPERVDPVTQEVVEWRPSIWFRLPIADDEDAPRGARSLHRVSEPPWTFRHCDDGSIEVRASIACGDPQYFHGYLNEGHEWVTV